MSNLYNRTYSLVVLEQTVEYVNRMGSPTPVALGEFSFPSTTPTFNDGNPEILPDQQLPIVEEKVTKSGTGVDIRGLHMEARIASANKDSSTSSRSTIKIYNLSPQTRVLVEKENAYVILSAGYNGDNGIIFKGNVVRYETVKEHPNVVTTLYCEDSNIILRTAKVSNSWEPNTTYGDIIRDIADRMQSEAGIAKGVIEVSVANDSGIPIADFKLAKGGFSFQGYLSQLLDELCDQFDLVWYVTLNELYIHPKRWKAYVALFDLRADIIKSIRPEQDKSSDKPTIGKPTGLKIQTFLDNRFKVGDAIRIGSDVADGRYQGNWKITEVEYDLSYEKDSWDVSVTVEALT